MKTKQNNNWIERWNKLTVKSFNLKTEKYQDEPIMLVNDKSWKIVKSFIQSVRDEAVEEAHLKWNKEMREMIGWEDATKPMPIREMEIIINRNLFRHQLLKQLEDNL